MNTDVVERSRRVVMNPTERSGSPRRQFADQFHQDVWESWQQHGKVALDIVARTDPAKYTALCASLIPKDVNVGVAAKMPGELSPADWHLMVAILDAVREGLPDAASKPPGEVMNFVLDAIRAHTAKAVN
jgi:hypothetical protein